MGRAGRKARNVKRERNGRADRKGLPRITFDHGTAKAQMKFEQYGTEGADAIGRAYVAGLLGPEADAIKDTARRIAKAYWPMLEVGTYRCTLSDAQGANDNPLDLDGNIKRREEWLSAILARVNRLGHGHRRAFDALVININPDSGPAFLDALIWAKGHGKPVDPLHEAQLARALEAINHIMG